MIINKQNIDRVFVNLKTTFNNAFDSSTAVWQKVAMKVSSSTKVEDYSWLSRFPQMREWIGEKNIKQLSAFKYSLTNKSYEATIEVDRDDLEDDQIGMLAPQAQGAGYSAKQWPDELVFGALNAGTTELCYDGQYFFDTDHPVGDTTVSNKSSLPLSIATQADAKASYGAVRTAMKNIKDEEGRPLNVMPNILLVPVALEDTANALMTNDRLEDGKPNLYKGTAEVVVSPHIADDDAWYLLDTTKPVKPLIFQERKKPMFVSMTSMASDIVFTLKKFLFGVEARGTAGYGFWQLAHKGN